MTVGELIDALSKYDRGQYACLILFSDHYPGGAQVILQGVRDHPPASPAPGLANVVQLLADDRNYPVPSEEEADARFRAWRERIFGLGPGKG